MAEPEASKRIKFGTPLWSERFLNLMHRKALTNYNDGTFCWGGEGGFYVESLADQNLPWAPAAQKLYGGTLTQEARGKALYTRCFTGPSGFCGCPSCCAGRWGRSLA